MNRSKKFVKFLKQEQKGGSSISSLGKTPSPALGVVTRSGSSYALDVPTIPKRRKKKDMEIKIKKYWCPRLPAIIIKMSENNGNLNNVFYIDDSGNEKPFIEFPKGVDLGENYLEF